MSFSFGGSTTKDQAQSQQQNDVPEWLQAAYKNNLTRATNTAESGFTPYTSAINATDNSLYRDARSTIAQAQQAGQGATDQAAGVFAGIANDSPVWMDPALVGQTVQAQAGQIGDVLDVRPERAAAGSIAGAGLAPYMNPYQSAVIDRSNGEIERQRQMAQGQNAYAAAQAGAFGGSRHGVVDAENNRNFAQLKQQNTNGLLQSGYGQAQGLLASDIDRQAGMSQFNVGQINAAETGNAERDLAARSADAAARQAASMANAAAENQRHQFNAAQITDANNGYRQADLAQSGLNLQGAQGLLSAGQQQQSLMLNQAQALAGAGDNIRTAQQAQYDADYGEFLRRQNDAFNKQQLANSAVFGIPSQSLQSTTGFNKSTGSKLQAEGSGVFPIPK